jgi:hypothetical protein
MATTFPSLNEKNKDENWHKQYVQAIVRDSITSTYDVFNASITLLYDYYNGVQSGDEYNFIQTSEDGETLPAKWINYNKIRTKVNLLLGELYKKGFEITTKTINAESKVRKLDEKRALLTQVKINKDLSSLESQYPLPITDPSLPEDEEGVEDYFQYSYTDIYETIISQALKYCGEIYRLKHLRLDLLRDIAVAGRCVLKSEIVGDVPILRRIDPRNFIFDTSCEDPLGKDCTYFGEIRYMSIADAAEQYGVDKKELQKLYEESRSETSIATRRNGMTPTSGSTSESFRQDGSEIKVMVFSAVWQDTKPFNHKESKDKYGQSHIKNIGDKEEKEKEGSKIIKKNVKIWRKATILGNSIVKDWGEIENQVRSIDNLSDTPAPYFICLPNWINQRAVSIVEQIKGLQDLKNIALYNLQLAMVRAGAKGFIYDVSQLPEDWLPEDMLRYLKTSGIAFIDSKKDGTPSQFNQFSSVDLSLAPSVQWYLEISRMIDNEVDMISGINEAREGTVQYATQTVGVTQSSLLQSNLKTESLYAYFDELMNLSLTHQAGLIKVAWRNKEVFAPIIGDTGVDFLNQEVDVDLQDYAVFVEYIPTALQDKDSLQSIVIAAMQSQQIGFVDAVKILREKDTVKAIKSLERSIMKREKQMMAQQQAQMEQQAQMQQAQMQQEGQQELGRQELEREKMRFDRATNVGKAKIDLLKNLSK